MPRKGITFKLVFYILASSTLIFAVIFGYNYLISRRIIAGDIRENAENLTKATANRIEIILRSVEKVPQNMSYFLEEGSYAKENLLALLRAVVEGNPEIYGSTIAFEPYAFEKDELYFAPYYYQVIEDGKPATKFTYLGGDNYKYFEWEWYRRPKELGKAVWSEPYYDEGGGNIIMSTYSAPFYRIVDGKKELYGVVTADVSLERLRDIVSSIKIGKTGYGFLVSGSGRLITHPIKGFIMKETLFGIADKRQDKNFAAIAADMAAGKRGYAYADCLVTGKNCWLAYVPLSSSGWSLGVVFPRDELFAGITDLNRVVLTLGIMGFFILLLVIVMIARSITRPLRVLDRLTKDIAAGNFDFELSLVRSDDEVGRLADSLNYMRKSLKQYIRELTSATKAKERMESELRIARDIQMSILPRAGASLKKDGNFDIYASISAAKEVGGDFYDFFRVDEKHLCFVIADVSDKGVPAALFMAMTKAFIRMSAAGSLEPDRILEKVNKEVCLENESCMFITAFLGILDTHSGKLYYANAGHNPPYIMRGSGGVEAVTGKSSTAIGLNPRTAFVKNELMLSAGDMILAYTDGVTEAFDAREMQFSQERLQKILAEAKGERLPRKIVRRVLKEVASFTQGREQSDDITLMALVFGPGLPQKAAVDIRLANDHADIAGLKHAWDGFCADIGLEEQQSSDLRLAMEEIASNIISYAWTDNARHWIDVNFSMENDVLNIRISDDGSPFNPLEYPPPDTNKPLDRRPEGGLGIYLARNLADNLEYRREGARNVLAITHRVK